jgi:hypothetical protein
MDARASRIATLRPGASCAQPPGRSDAGQAGAHDQHVEVLDAVLPGPRAEVVTESSQQAPSAPPPVFPPIGAPDLPAGDTSLPSDDMDPMVRAAGLRGLVPLVDRLGGDGAALLARFGVPPRALDSDDAVMRAGTAARVLEVAADELACPDLGLRLAEQQDAGVLGPLAIAIENSPTFGDALDCTSRFLFVHSPALSVDRVDDPEGRPGVIGIRYDGTGPGRLPPQVADLGLGLVHRIIVLLHAGPYGLRSVHLPHPPLAPVGRYTGFFGADVRFDRPGAVLRVPSGIVATPVVGGDRMLREVVLDYMAAHFTAPGQTVTGRVRCCSGAGARVVAGATWPTSPDCCSCTRARCSAGWPPRRTSFEAVLDGVPPRPRPPPDHHHRPAVRHQSRRWSGWRSSPPR